MVDFHAFKTKITKLHHKPLITAHCKYHTDGDVESDSIASCSREIIRFSILQQLIAMIPIAGSTDTAAAHVNLLAYGKRRLTRASSVWRCGRKAEANSM